MLAPERGEIYCFPQHTLHGGMMVRTDMLKFQLPGYECLYTESYIHALYKSVCSKLTLTWCLLIENTFAVDTK
jgi:hypothetical protein